MEISINHLNVRKQHRMNNPLLLDPMRFPTPEAQFEEMFQAAEGAFAMLAVVWPDDGRRAEQMQEYADQKHGIYFSCKKCVTEKELLVGLAKALSIDVAGAFDEIFERISEYLKREKTTLFLDNADQLTQEQLRNLRDLHDVAGVILVFASGSTVLQDYVNDQDLGGQFSSRCWYREITT